MAEDLRDSEGLQSQMKYYEENVLDSSESAILPLPAGVKSPPARAASTNSSAPRKASPATQPRYKPNAPSVSLTPLDDVDLAVVPDDETDEWAFSDTVSDIVREEAVSLDSDWEVIDKEMLDNATNTMLEVPSAVAADPVYQAVFNAWKEKCRPTEETQRTFWAAMSLLKTAGEVTYLTVKEPLVDWAEGVVQDNLACGLNELPSELSARLVNSLPERTRNLLTAVHGTFRQRGFIDPPNITAGSPGRASSSGSTNSNRRQVQQGRSMDSTDSPQASNSPTSSAQSERPNCHSPRGDPFPDLSELLDED